MKITKTLINNARKSDDVLTYNGINGKEWKKDIFSLITQRARQLRYEGIETDGRIKFLNEKNIQKQLEKEFIV